MNYRRIATFTGWLWIITFVTSIPARFFFYAPVLDHEGNYVTGAGTDAQTLIAIGAVLVSVAGLSGTVWLQNFDGPAIDNKRYQAGLTYYIRGHNANLKAAYSRLDPDGGPG